jgi:hypothetical protein
MCLTLILLVGDILKLGVDYPKIASSLGGAREVCMRSTYDMEIVALTHILVDTPHIFLASNAPCMP